MNRVLPSLCLFLAAVSCRSAPPAVEVVGPRRANLGVGLERALDVVPRAGTRLGYDWHQVLPEPTQVVLRTPPEQAFFTMVGEQVRFQEAVVRLRVRGKPGERGGERVEMFVDATLVHGPPGGPFQRKERVGQEWYDAFFEAVAFEIESQESEDAPSVEP